MGQVIPNALDRATYTRWLIRVECKCRRVRYLNAYDLKQSFRKPPKSWTFSEIAQQMKCSACGQKDPRITVAEKKGWDETD